MSRRHTSSSTSPTTKRAWWHHNLLCDWDDTESMAVTDHRFVPSAVFTDPQLASVGLTENQALAEGYDISVKIQDYGDVAYGWAMEDTTGIVKLIAERGTGRLLGAHFMGHEASMLIQPLIQAMSFGLTAREMARGQYWIHPALPEVVENALLGLQLTSAWQARAQPVQCQAGLLRQREGTARPRVLESRAQLSRRHFDDRPGTGCTPRDGAERWPSRRW